VIATTDTHWRCRLYDANGVQIHYAVWADTDTGEVVVLCRDSDGRIEPATDDSGRETVKKEWQQHPAPLRLVPMEAVS
jgi:hypothetical protein